MPDQKDYSRLRHQMVEEQLVARGIRDARVLNIMRRMPRHDFVPDEYKKYAYDDCPLPIGEGQTISQPYMVAFMTERLELTPDDVVLELGTGAGYQTAILAELVKYVYSLERISRLADLAGERLSYRAYQNVDVHVGDGSQGLADMSPFNAIMVTASAPKVPGVLCSQLHPDGGRMIIPVGDYDQQELMLVTRRGDKINIRALMLCKFVPLIGRYGFKSRDDDSTSV